MSELGPVVVRSTIAAPHETVWQQIVAPDRRAEWWNGTTFEAQEGAELQDATRGLTGTVDVVVQGLTLGFRWSAEGAGERTVMMMLRPEDDNYDDTRVTVIESGFAVLPNASELVAESTRQWEELLSDLGATLAPDAAEVEENDVDAAEAEGTAPTEVPAAEDATNETTPSDGAASDDEATPAEATAVEVADDFEDTVIADSATAEEEIVDGEPVEDATVAEDAAEDSEAAEDASVEDATALQESDEAAEEAAVSVHDDTEADDGEDTETPDEDVATAILLPEVGGSSGPDTGVHITQDLGVEEELDVEETSEWERLLRGDDID